LESRLPKDCWRLGVGHEVVVAVLIEVENHPEPVVLVGSRKTCEPLDPCCLRFSAPFVEKAFQNRSKSSIFTVARTIFSSFVGRVVALL
jgi:hypothetical protein